MEDLNEELFEAVFDNDEELIRFLIKDGADVNKQYDEAGWTPLHFASCYGLAKVVKILIEAEADVNITDENDETPLMIALSEGHTEIIELLKQHGAKE